MQNATMSPIIRQFATKVPIHLLEKYRRLMRENFTAGLKYLFDMTNKTGAPYVNISDKDYLITGSTAEGASLARLFSPDSNTAREFEFDVMISFSPFLADEAQLHYIEQHKAFAHISVDSKVLTLVTTLYGTEAAQTLVYWKENGLYLSNLVGKIDIQLGMAHSPNLLEKAGFRPSVVEKDCSSSKASIAIQLEEDISESQCAEASDTYAREAQINANASELMLQLIDEMKPHCETFETKITEMLTHLATLEDEFVQMRTEAVSIYDQATKALEWAMSCMFITDFIFDTRQVTFVRLMNQCVGWNATAMEKEQRRQIHSKLQYIMDVLNVSRDDLRDPAVADLVCQRLSIIESMDICPKRFVLAFNDFAELQIRFSKVLTLITRHPEVRKTPPPLQHLAGSIKRMSVDFVPAFKLMFWPSVAVQWKTRDRLWPVPSIIEEIVNKGTHLVGKAFCHDDIDWRLSFSVAEIALATRWSPVQHFVYFIFKSLFYKFIKPLSSDTVDNISPNTSSKKYLASYTAKTVMMWTSESFDQSWWREDNLSECLTVLLLALQSAFECRTLDHYFVSEVNLLKDIPDILASHVIDKINFILAEPEAVVGLLENDFPTLKIFLNAMGEQSKVMTNASTFFKLLNRVMTTTA